MANVYERAERIQRNLKLSSDNVELMDCYYLCANKQHIEELRVNDHQVIWGRRGTGKTTLLKAFAYDVNNMKYDPEIIAMYIVMARVIPTKEEIEKLTGDGSSLAVYIFSKLINEICKELESLYSSRSSVMEPMAEEHFLVSFYELQDYLKIYQTVTQGGQLKIDSLKSKEIKKEISKDIGVNVNVSKGVAGAFVSALKKDNKIKNVKESYALDGTIEFKLETQVIGEYIIKMLDALGISFTYICLDEYSEIDKVSEYSIQSKVAQLIKQVFFKNPRYSVKIATIWHRSKLHSRGGNQVEGIEYQQDIFAGPDLDIMFMENNADIINYFKEVLINTYLMGEEINEEEKSALSDYFEANIFGTVGFSHLICGSQGVSRSFVILVKAYLQRFLKRKRGPVKIGRVYEIIKHQYLEDVRNKIPYYTLYKVIDKFIVEKTCRYFLIRREDYDRCKTLFNYLTAKGVFIQLPGHLTDKRLRDEYRLFIIHYGSYLDALESESFKRGRRTLEDDAKLEASETLIPEYDIELINKPELYTVYIPEDIEKEIFCMNCEKIFVSDVKGDKVECPYCHHEVLRFAEFMEEISL